MKKVQFNGWNTIAVQSKYGNDTLAIILVDENDVFGAPVSVATVNLSVPYLAPNQQFVKDYSENSGMLDALKNAGMVDDIVGESQTGYVTVPLVQFNLDGVLTMAELEAEMKK